jgi:hypothetical protein
MHMGHSRGSQQNTQKFFNTNGNISKKVGTQIKAIHFSLEDGESMFSPPKVWLLPAKQHSAKNPKQRHHTTQQCDCERLYVNSMNERWTW